MGKPPLAADLMKEATGLVVSGLTVKYRVDGRVVAACEDVSLSVGPGEKLGLVGESGSGKTTAALSLIGMLHPSGEVTAGRAILCGVDLFGLDAETRRSFRLSQVSYVPQGAMSSLNPVVRVRDQILHGMVDHGIYPESAQAKRDIDELLVSVGLSPATGNCFPHELSGGMKQRVCIAAAVALEPKLIIADEPTSALDVISQQQVMATLDMLQKKHGFALILIGHDMGLMAQFADRLTVMQDGRVVEDGTVREIFQRPRQTYTRTLISSVPTLDTRSSQKLQEKSVDIQLQFEAAGMTYDGAGAPALQPIHMQIGGGPARIVAIAGESGSGKTTLGSIALGIARPSHGRVLYRGNDISKLGRAESKSFRKAVQAIFQDPYATFNPFYRVDHALEMPLRKLGISKRADEIRARLEVACEAVGLSPSLILGRYPHALSGGQRQRLMVARALAIGPELLVADEPVSMVDASLRLSILNNIRALRDDHNVSVMYITHDLATARATADFVLILRKGRIVEAGRPEEVIDEPQHPYTQKLVDAVPWPDPDRVWKTDCTEGDFDSPSIYRSTISGFSVTAADMLHESP